MNANIFTTAGNSSAQTFTITSSPAPIVAPQNVNHTAIKPEFLRRCCLVCNNTSRKFAPPSKHTPAHHPAADTHAPSAERWAVVKGLSAARYMHTHVCAEARDEALLVERVCTECVALLEQYESMCVLLHKLSARLCERYRRSRQQRTACPLRLCVDGLRVNTTYGLFLNLLAGDRASVCENRNTWSHVVRVVTSSLLRCLRAGGTTPALTASAPATAVSGLCSAAAKTGEMGVAGVSSQPSILSNGHQLPDSVVSTSLVALKLAPDSHTSVSEPTPAIRSDDGDIYRATHTLQCCSRCRCTCAQTHTRTQHVACQTDSGPHTYLRKRTLTVRCTDTASSRTTAPNSGTGTQQHTHRLGADPHVCDTEPATVTRADVLDGWKGIEFQMPTYQPRCREDTLSMLSVADTASLLDRSDTMSVFSDYTDLNALAYDSNFGDKGFFEFIPDFNSQTDTQSVTSNKSFSFASNNVVQNSNNYSSKYSVSGSSVVDNGEDILKELTETMSSISEGVVLDDLESYFEELSDDRVDIDNHSIPDHNAHRSHVVARDVCYMYPCGFCDKCFTDRCQAIRHMSECHVMSAEMMRVCGKTRFSCRHCKKCFDRYYRLCLHRARFHDYSISVISKRPLCVSSVYRNKYLHGYVGNYLLNQKQVHLFDKEKKSTKKIRNCGKKLEERQRRKKTTKENVQKNCTTILFKNIQVNVSEHSDSAHEMCQSCASSLESSAITQSSAIAPVDSSVNKFVPERGEISASANSSMLAARTVDLSRPSRQYGKTPSSSMATRTYVAHRQPRASVPCRTASLPECSAAATNVTDCHQNLEFSQQMQSLSLIHGQSGAPGRGVNREISKCVRLDTSDGLPETLHSCSVCSRQFERRDSLQKHLATHTSLYEHSCHICGKRFKQERIMKKHVKLMHTPASHQCGHCVRVFRTNYALRTHVKRVHCK